MNKDQTLRKSLEIEKVVKEKKSVGNKFYAIYYSKTNDNKTKVAVSASKKLGHATVRNYQKRVTKEIVREMLESIKNYKMLIVVKIPALDLSFLEKKGQLIYLIRKILKENVNE